MENDGDSGQRFIHLFSLKVSGKGIEMFFYSDQLASVLGGIIGFVGVFTMAFFVKYHLTVHRKSSLFETLPALFRFMAEVVLSTLFGVLLGFVLGFIVGILVGEFYGPITGGMSGALCGSVGGFLSSLIKLKNI